MPTFVGGRAESLFPWFANGRRALVVFRAARDPPVDRADLFLGEPRTRRHPPTRHHLIETARLRITWRDLRQGRAVVEEIRQIGAVGVAIHAAAEDVLLEPRITRVLRVCV